MGASSTRLARAADQAAGFGRTRDAHRAEIAEDYVELIADLIDATGEARAIDLAHRLGVTPATVNNTIARLQREGLVRSEPYRAIFLTDDGRALALSCRRRHRIVIDFLHAIGRLRGDGPAGCRGHRAPCQRGDADRPRPGHPPAAGRLQRLIQPGKSRILR